MCVGVGRPLVSPLVSLACLSRSSCLVSLASWWLVCLRPGDLAEPRCCRHLVSLLVSYVVSYVCLMCVCSCALGGVWHDCCVIA